MIGTRKRTVQLAAVLLLLLALVACSAGTDVGTTEADAAPTATVAVDTAADAQADDGAPTEEEDAPPDEPAADDAGDETAEQADDEPADAEGADAATEEIEPEDAAEGDEGEIAEDESAEEESTEEADDAGDETAEQADEEQADTESADAATEEIEPEDAAAEGDEGETAEDESAEGESTEEADDTVDETAEQADDEQADAGSADAATEEIESEDAAAEGDEGETAEDEGAEGESTEEADDAGDEAADQAYDEQADAESADAAATEEVASEDAAAEGDEGETAEGEESTAPRVFFRQPTDNAIIPPTSTVLMGVEGLTVEAAGEVNADAGHLHIDAGHLHIMVDASFIAPGEGIPKDETHLHFGDGATAAEITLEPGVHILRLQFADGNHIALEGDEYRDEIVVRVAEDAPEQAVRFVTPTNGAVVPPTFPVVMAATGLVVEPSGEVVENAGHLHILVDTDFVEPGQGVPKDEQHLHFGAGETEVEVSLEPGEHTLRLQFADGDHIALEGEQYRDEITVTVEPDAPSRKVMFVMPQEGDTVTGTFPVEWAASGLIIEPAGVNLAEGHGHVHLLVDTDFIDANFGMPMDETHRHFGGGQTATELTLEPGEHTLRLQMTNGTHTAFDGDEYRDEITITVE